MKLRLRHCMTFWVIIGMGFMIPAFMKISDPDLWWHLKTGQLILAERSVPSTDPYSFTALNHPWTVHEWLFEVLLYTVFAHLKFLGLVLLQATLVSAAFLGIYLLVRRRTSNHPAALIITALCGIATLPLWDPRPQLLTYVLLTALLLLLQKPHSRRLWLAVPMFCLWSNLHGAWIFGFVVLLTILAEASIGAVRSGKPALAWRAAAVCACSLAAVLIGPHPVDRLVYPFQYFSGSLEVRHVLEFQSPDFHNRLTIPYELILLSLPVLTFLGRKRLGVSEWLLLLATMHLSLESGRHIPLFAIMAAPVLASQAQGALDRRKQTRPVDRPESTLLNLAIILVLPILIWSHLPRINDEAHYVFTKDLPTAACRYLADRPTIGKGRLLNSYNWGGYLIFRLYPKYKISLDGRADVHQEHTIRDLKALETLSPDWKKVLSELDPDAILWPTDKPLTVLLRQDPTWQTLYKDQTATIFTKTTP